MKTDFIQHFFTYLFKIQYMTIINSFETLIKQLQSFKVKTKVAVVYGVDTHSEEAISAAIEHEFIDVVMVGPKELVQDYPIFVKYPESVTYIDSHDPDEAARLAVNLIHSGEASVLMKGLINTDNLLKVVLDKKHGLLPAYQVLSHLAVADIPSYSKLLFFTDAAVIPYPKLEQKAAQLKYVIDVCNKFGIIKPKVALLHFTEKVNPKFPNSTDCITLKNKALAGEFGDVIVDGPIDLSTACTPDSGNIKGVNSLIQGDADALLLPNIESGNIFYKSVSVFAKAEMAGILLGTTCPVVTTSRSDSSRTKFYSIAMACLMKQNQTK